MKYLVDTKLLSVLTLLFSANILLFTNTAMAVTEGEAICIEARMELKNGRFKKSKRLCKGVTEGEAICIGARMRFADGSFEKSKDRCAGITEGEAICIEARMRLKDGRFNKSKRLCRD